MPRPPPANGNPALHGCGPQRSGAKRSEDEDHTCHGSINSKRASCARATRCSASKRWRWRNAARRILLARVRRDPHRRGLRLCDDRQDRVGAARRRQQDRYQTSDQVVARFKRDVKNFLTLPDMGLQLERKPAVILIIGVNGSGKTTTIGKLATALNEIAAKYYWSRPIRFARRRRSSSRFGPNARGSTSSAATKAPIRRRWCSTEWWRRSRAAPTS